MKKKDDCVIEYTSDYTLKTTRVIKIKNIIKILKDMKLVFTEGYGHLVVYDLTDNSIKGNTKMVERLTKDHEFISDDFGRGFNKALDYCIDAFNKLPPNKGRKGRI